MDRARLVMELVVFLVQCSERNAQGVLGRFCWSG